MDIIDWRRLYIIYVNKPGPRLPYPFSNPFSRSDPLLTRIASFANILESSRSLEGWSLRYRRQRRRLLTHISM